MKYFKTILLAITYATLIFFQGCQSNTKPIPENPVEHNNSTEHPMLKKPAIYLYPERTQKIQVSLKINGSLLTSVPEYNDGWSVTASPDGMIDGQYDYLFYENSLNTLELPAEGWIKRYSELDGWLSSILPKLGLNAKETRQFKEYWLEELESDGVYEIKLLSQDFLAQNVSLDIHPRPDSIIRVHLHFKKIDKAYDLKEPDIQTRQRVGFSVLEWGGIGGD